MRILLVMMDVPYPPRRGQRMRNWAVLRALAQEGHAISLISLTHSPDAFDSREMLSRYCEQIELVSARTSKLPGPAHRLAGMFSSLPFAAFRMNSPELREAVQREAGRRAYDVILWDEVYNLVNLPKNLQAPVVLNTQDVIRVIWERFMQTERNPFKRAYCWLEHRKLCKWEERSSWPISSIIACSAHDSVAYRKMYPELPVTVANNSIDMEHYDLPISDDGRTVLFVGGLDWFPNLDAVTFFADKILPTLRARRKDFRFVVAGKVPSQTILKRFAHIPEIEFTGEVESMPAIIASASVCVVPLRIGSGTRMKILEAAAMYKPIVSTSIGAEGLDFVSGKEIVIADDPNDFALKIDSLLADHQRRSSMGRAARQRVESTYSLPALRNALNEAFAEYVGSNRSMKAATPV